MVGARGFEPPTPCSQSRCATSLRHAPKKIENNKFELNENQEGFPARIRIITFAGEISWR